MLVLLKILILAAKSPFATFKMLTVESLDSPLPLLEENAEASDAEILFRSFFACPCMGSLEESVLRVKDVDPPVLILHRLTFALCVAVQVNMA